MKFFETEKVEKPKTHAIWAEKYRPTNFDTYVGNDALSEAVKNIVKTKDMPHMMFHASDPGTGKTTIAKLITSYLDCDVMYVNASDNTKVDFVREEIKPFAQTNGFHSLKVIILDEADFLSPSNAFVIVLSKSANT